jgi:hypothetical protein
MDYEYLSKDQIALLEQILGGPNADTSMAITKLKENPLERSLIDEALYEILGARYIQDVVNREIQSQKPPVSPLPLAQFRRNVKQEGISPEQLYQDLSQRHSNPSARQRYWPTPDQEEAVQRPRIEQIMSMLSRQR